MQPSELPHERSFTWVRDDLKVQLVRPFHPFPPRAAQGLPVKEPSRQAAEATVTRAAQRMLIRLAG